MHGQTIIGQYIPGNSQMHKMDPRAKLLCLFLFMIFLFVGKDPFLLFSAIVIATFSFITAKIPLRFYWKGFRFIVVIVLFTFIFHVLLTKEGPILLSTPFFSVHTGGVIGGGFFAIRLLLLILMATLLTMTTTPVDLTDALEKLLRPLNKVGVPVYELALMMSIALRFIPTLMEEAEKIIKAQIARGAKFSQGPIWSRFKALLPIFIPLFVQSFKRAEDLATAMEARGYSGSHGRTKYRILSWKKTDTAAVSLFGFYGLVVIIVRTGGGL